MPPDWAASPETELERLLRVARTQPGLQPVLFRTLLETSLYGLAPLANQEPRDDVVRFLTWQREDGHTVIPCFSSEAKALSSAQNHARPLRLGTRQLMEATRGATLHIDPNDFGCTLFPADIDNLLATGAVDAPESSVLTEPEPAQFAAPADPPQAMLEALAILYRHRPEVRAARLVEMREQALAEAEVRLLVVLELAPGVPDDAIAQESTTVIRATYSGPGVIDLVTPEPHTEFAQAIASHFSPFYEKVEGRSRT